MKQFGRRSLAIILAVLMVLSVCPLWLISIPVAAEGTAYDADWTKNEKSWSVPVPVYSENNLTSLTINGKTYTTSIQYADKDHNPGGFDFTIPGTGLEWAVYTYKEDNSWELTYGIIIKATNVSSGAAVPDNWSYAAKTGYKQVVPTFLSEVYVADGVTGIGNNVFRDNLYLKNVYLSESVKSIGDYCFSGCGVLETVNLAYVESIGKYCFFDSSNVCNKFTGSCVESDGTTLYGGVAIATGSGAVLRYIGEHAFRGCSAVRAFYVGSGESNENRGVINGYTFYNTYGIKKYEFGNNLTITGNHNFSYSYNIDAVKFGDNVSIGYLAFYYCYNMTTLTFGNNDDIGSRAFDRCYSVTSSEGKDYLDLTGVHTIGTYAFRANSDKLKKVVFGLTLTSIGDYAFSDCSSLEEINLCDTSITAIPKGCFERTSIASVVIPKDVVSIGNFAFSAYVSNGTSRGDNSGWYVSGSTVYGSGHTGLAKLKTVSFETGSVCASIGSYAFYRQGLACEINFPATLTSIGDYAFYCAGSLGDVVLPATTDMTVGGAAFDSVGVTSLTVNANNNFTCGGWAFAYNNIAEINIAATNKVSLGNYSFYRTKYLEELVINAATTTIGAYAFSTDSTYAQKTVYSSGNYTLGYPDYQTLKTVTITGSKVTIGESAFRYMMNLQTLNLLGIKNINNLSVASYGFGHNAYDAFSTVNDPLILTGTDGQTLRIMIKHGMTVNLGCTDSSAMATVFQNEINYYRGNSYTTELTGYVSPTCTEEGYYTYLLTILEGANSVDEGSTFPFKVAIPALGHMYSDEVFYDADCVYGEYAEKHCLRGCVSHQYGVNDDGYAITSTGSVVTEACNESGSTVITETENAECLNHEYYAGRLYYKTGVEKTTEEYANLGEDQRSNFFIRYKHKTTNQIITAYAYGKLEKADQANYSSLYVGTLYLTQSEYDKLDASEQEALKDSYIDVGRIIYGDITVNDGKIKVYGVGGSDSNTYQEFTSPFNNYIPVYIEYGCYRDTHHVLTDTESYPYRVAYLPTNLTGKTDQQLKDIYLELKNLGWADETTSLAGSNGTRTYAGIYKNEGNGVDVFKDVELDIKIAVTRVEISIENVTMTNTKQSTAVTRTHVGVNGLPTGASSVSGTPDAYFENNGTSKAWTDIESSAIGWNGYVTYKITYKNSIYDLVADTDDSSSIYWNDGVYNSSASCINSAALFKKLAKGYTLESIEISGDDAIVTLKHSFVLQTPSLEIVDVIADSVTYDGTAHGFKLTDVPASSSITVTEWTTADSSGLAKDSGYTASQDLSAPASGKTLLTDLRDVDTYSNIVTSAGTYYFKITVDNAGYSGNESGTTGGTTYTFYTTVVIAKAALSIPNGTSYEYDGTAKTGFAADEKYTISGDNVASSANTYNVTLHLNDSNYYWKGQAENNPDATASWKIQKMTVKVPTVDETKRTVSYNGFYQSPLNLTTVNTVSSTGTPKTGDYRAYQDTKDKTKLNVEYYYNGQWNILYQLNCAFELNVGTSYTIQASEFSTFSGLFDTENLTWPNNQTSFSLGIWSIETATIDNPTITLPNKEYDGQPYNETEVLSGTWTEVNSNGNVFNQNTEGITFKYYSGNTLLSEKPTAVGLYTVKAEISGKLKDHNYVLADVTSSGLAYAVGTFQISKMKVTLISSNATVSTAISYSYDGQAKELPAVSFENSQGTPVTSGTEDIVLRWYKTTKTQKNDTVINSQTGLEETVVTTVYELDESYAGTLTCPTFSDIGTYVYMVAIDSECESYESVNYATVVLTITKSEQGISVTKQDQNANPTVIKSGSNYIIEANLGDEVLKLDLTGEFDKKSVINVAYGFGFGSSDSAVQAKTEAQEEGGTVLSLAFVRMTTGSVITLSTDGTANAGAATCTVTIKVSKARPNVSVSSALIGNSAAYTGNTVYSFTTEVNGTSAVALSGQTTAVAITRSGALNGCTLLYYTDSAKAYAYTDDYSLTNPVSAGDYWVVARYDGDDNYLVGYSIPVNFAIGEAALTVNGVSNISRHYDGSYNNLTANITVTGNGKALSSSANSSAAVGEYWIEYYPVPQEIQPEATLAGWSTTMPQVKDVASSGVYWYRVSSKNYQTATRSVTVTIEKVDVNVNVTMSLVTTRQYDGTNKLYNAVGSESFAANFSAAVNADASTVAHEIAGISATATTGAVVNVYTGAPVTVVYTVTGQDRFDAGNFKFNGSSTLDSKLQFSDSSSYTGSITPKELTVTGIAAVARQYDGTKTVLLDGTNAVVTGFIGDEYITFTLNSSAVKGELGSATTGSETVVKYVSNGSAYYNDDYTGMFTYVLSGALLSNYKITSSSYPTATISKRDVVVNSSAVTREYTYTGAQITGYKDATLETKAATYNTDAASVATDLASEKSKLVYNFYTTNNAGVLSGFLGNNTSPTQVGTYYLEVVYSGSINYAEAKSEIITIKVNSSSNLVLTPDSSKITWTYDGTAHSFKDMVASVAGTSADGTISSSAYSVKFYLDGAYTIEVTDIKNVASSGTYYYKVNAANYKEATGSFKVTINKKNLTITNPTVTTTRIYDGTKSVAVTGTPAVSGAVLSEHITATATAQYNSADVASATTITITYDVTFAAGADPSNYSYTAGTNSKAAFTGTAGNYKATETVGGTIKKAPLSIGHITANTRVYDGTHLVDLLTATATLNGVVDVDSTAVELDYIPSTGIVADAHYSADAKTVIVAWSSATLKGTRSGNYEVTSGSTVTVNINKATPDFTWIGTLTAGWSGGPVDLSYYEIKVTGNETPAELLADKGTNSSAITYTFWRNAECTSSATSDPTGETAPTEKGKYYVKASYAGTNDYEEKSEVKVLTITETGIFGGESVISSANWVYDGKSHNVITDINIFSDLLEGGVNKNITASSNAKVYIALKTGNTRPENSSSVWKLAYGYKNGALITSGLEQIKDAGTYTYWIKITADNHADCDYFGSTHATTITVTVSKATITVGSTVTKTKVYDGKTSMAVTSTSITGIQNGENISLAVVAKYADKTYSQAGKAYTVTYTLTYGGASSSANYIVVAADGATLTQSENSFTASYADGVITKKQIVIVDVTAVDRIYNNTKTVVLGGTPVASGGLCTDDDANEDDVTFSLIDNATGTTSSAIPGTYTVTVKTTAVTATGADKDNYEIVSVASPTVTISKKQLSISFGGKTSGSGIGSLTDKTFTNKAMVLADLEKASVNGTVEGGAAASAIVYTYWKNSGCTTAAVAGSAAIAPTSTGTYYVKAETATNAYYTGSYVVAKVEVKNATLNVSATAYNGTYDGQSHAPATFTVNGVDGGTITAYTVKFYKDYERTQEISTVRDHADTGTYYYTISFADYDDYEGSVSVDIARQAVSISSILTTEKTYDAKTKADVKSAAITAGTTSAATLVNSEFNISAAANYDDKNAGTGKTITTVYTLTAKNGGKFDNYTVNGEVMSSSIAVVTSTTAKINKKTVTISGAIANDKTYDGTTAATFKNRGSAIGFCAGDDVKLVTGSAAVVFSSANAADSETVKFSGYALSGTDAENYTLSQPANGTAKISKKNIASAVITLGKSLTYNGLEQTQTISSAIIDGLKITYTVSGNKKTNAGTYTLTITGNGNFEGTATKTYTIARADYDMSGISFTNKSFVYDGTSHSLVIAGTLPTGSDGIAVTVSYSGSQTNAGSSAVVATFATTSSNYNTPAKMTAYVTVTKRNITITPDDKTKTYGDDDPATSYKVTSGALVAGQKLTDIVISRTAGQKVDEYTYSINGTLANNKNANYNITVETGKLTITKRAIEITVKDQTHEYNKAEPWTGNKQTSTAETYWTVSSGAIQSNGNVQDSKASLNVVLTKYSGTNVGSGAITGAYTNSNYDVTFVNGTYTITPRTVEIVIGNAGKEYGETPDLSKVTLTAKKGGAEDSVAKTEIETIRAALKNFKINANAQSTVKTYSISADSGVYGNYDVTITNGVYTVSKRPITIKANKLTKCYDVIPADLTYTITSGNLVNSDAITVVLNSAITRSTPVGSTAITVTSVTMSDGIDKTANYEITTVDDCYEVTPAHFTVSFENGKSTKATVFGNDYLNKVVLFNTDSGREMTADNGNAFDGSIIWTTSSTAIATVSSDGTVTPVNTGVVTVTVSFTGGTNYTITTASASYDLAIAPAGSITGTVTAYNGKQQLTDARTAGQYKSIKLVELTIINPDPTSYTLVTKYSTDGGQTWSTNVPEASAAGTYTVDVWVYDEGGHYGEYRTTVIAAISARDEHLVRFITDEGVIAGSSAVIVTDGVYLTAADFPTATRTGYSFAGWKNMSTGEIKTAAEWVSSKLEVTATMFFEAQWQAVALTAEVVSSSVAYTGKPICPALVVKSGTDTLTEGKDYTLFYENNLKAGTATVTLIGSGAYAGMSLRKTFTVAQAQNSIDNLTIDGWTYGDAAKVPTANAKFGTIVYTYSVRSSGIWSATAPAAAGEYTVKAYVAATAEYASAEATYDFTITAKSISSTSVDAIPAQIYTGSAIEPKIIVRDGGKVLTEGVDYTVSYANNVNAGMADVTVTFAGNYSGSTTVHFAINADNGVEVQVSDTYFVYDGSAKYPTVEVTDTGIGSILTEDYDYYVEYATASGATVAEPTAAGTYKVTVIGEGNYDGILAEAYFTIGKAETTASVSGTTVTYAYGMKIAARPVTSSFAGKITYVSSNTNVITVNADGTLNVLAAGEAVITAYVEGDANHTSTSATCKVKVNAADIDRAVAEAIADQTYTGAPIIVVPVLSDGIILTAGADFTVSYEDNINKGTVTVNISGIGNYTGEKILAYKIVAKTLNATAIDAIAPQEYTGSALEPKLIVRDGLKVLTEGTEYTVSYRNNVKTGTADVTVTFTGNYAGTADVHFTIKAQSGLEAKIENTSFVYDGNAKYPAVTVKDAVLGQILSSGIDYYVIYKNADNQVVSAPTVAGTYTVSVIGTGNYTGELTTSQFVITKIETTASFAKDDVTALYVPGGKLGANTLSKSFAGAVTYTSSNTACVSVNADGTLNIHGVGTAIITATVAGDANHESATATYRVVIGQRDIAQASADAISAKIYTGEPITVSPVLTDSSALVEGKDYTVSYSNNINKGTATVTVTGMGNYTGTKQLTFAITAKTLGSSSVTTVPSMSYTGDALEPAVIVRDGLKVLTEGKDYTVAYANNVNVGTAEVTVVFTGNYTGNGTVTFEITAQKNDISVDTETPVIIYNGEPQVTPITVYDGGMELIEGEDYTTVIRDAEGNIVTDPAETGLYTVEIVGKGNYDGVLATTSYIITAYGASAYFTDANVTKTYGDAAFINVLNYVPANEHGTAVYTSSDSAVATVDSEGRVTIRGIGTAVITANVSATANTAECSASFTLTVEAKSGDGFDITLEGDMRYNGNEIKPAVTVKDGDITLVEGVDYTVSYENNVNVGTATAVITYIGNYAGEESKEYTITAKAGDISAELGYTKTVYDKTEKIPAVTVRDGLRTLTEGTDYTVVIRDENGNVVTSPVAAGVYTVEIHGEGNYNGLLTSETYVIKAVTTKASFAEEKIAKTYGDADFTNVLSIIPADEHGGIVYTSSDTTVATVDAYGKVTVVGVGSAVITATVSATDNTTGATASYTVTVAQKSNKQNTVTLTGSTTYTGKAVVPGVTIYDGNKRLTEGVDYKLTYVNNINAGTGTVKISYIGNYTGESEAKFVISPWESRITAVISNTSFVYNGKTQQPTVTVKDGTTLLIAGRDYDLVIYNNAGKTVTPCDAGTYTLSVVGRGNYSGTIVSAVFSITAAPVAAKFESAELTKTYGDADFTNKLTLTPATDGNLIFRSSNTAVATVDANGKVTIVGTGSAKISVYAAASNNYQAASAEYSLTVKAMGITGFTMDKIARQVYTGEAITPRVTVRNGDKLLIEGRDYTVAYADNKAVGTAKVTVTGMGDYAGTVAGSFEIVANTNVFEIADIAEVVYTGEKVEPKPEIRYAGVLLTEGEDYEISYINNDQTGVATLVVTGKGAYEGLSGMANYEINASSISSVDPVTGEADYIALVSIDGGFGGSYRIDVDHVDEVAGSTDKLPDDARYFASGAATKYASYTESQLAELTSGKKIILTLDIKLMYENVVVTEFDGKTVYTVKLLVPEELYNASEIQVAYITEDGRVEIFETEVEDGYITFQTTHFSEFIFMGKTPWFSWWWILVLCCIICGATLTVCIIITKKKKDEDTDGKDNKNDKKANA